MEQITDDALMLWTQDLTVGSPAMDARNKQLFFRLAEADMMLASCIPEHLATWLLGVYDDFLIKLEEEESELAAIGYPEQEYHWRMHDRARVMMRTYRTEVERAASIADLEAIARRSCTALSVWLMRHVIDADKLFFPYVDARFRVT